MIINSYLTIQALRSVAFFIRLKKERNARFSPFNHFIIISIYLLLTIRLILHLGLNLMHLYSLIYLPDEGLLFPDERRVILQLRSLGELSLICYMLRVQDKRI